MAIVGAGARPAGVCSRHLHLSFSLSFSFFFLSFPFSVSSCDAVDDVPVSGPQGRLLVGCGFRCSVTLGYRLFALSSPLMCGFSSWRCGLPCELCSQCALRKVIRACS
ncbi:hypothetical protein B0T26DRAFT_158008 [Lasiosphaeria miniovina]|uniref:Secreted protein n=1 Tax=Lasiosphaeria miniovina TaxID=1954250 RepID=A0AA40EA99_9PEZI|nr:uncharacterized protein B0T26DRAFT_158008 [Lasiosphaeria miniovina]KAK0728103.1 hypothetical protein B0T26DRAFT_158008 [Lasiosphaeria miniovina]